MNTFGFVRVTAACHKTAVADPAANASATLACLDSLQDSNIVVFGELSLTGYTCGDLFAQDKLLQSTVKELARLAEASRSLANLFVVGAPLRVNGRLYNCAVAIAGGKIIAVVPKQYLPNYQEFYEARWFTAAEGDEPSSFNFTNVGEAALGEVPFGTDILIEYGDATIGIELCEDLWMPIPPSSLQAAAGANVLLNLSASNELIGKADWRETLVRSQSGRCLAAYAYASAGPSESTTDLVFSGHCLISENGRLLSSGSRIGQPNCQWLDETFATADVDLQSLNHERQVTVSWQQATKRSTFEFRRIRVDAHDICHSDGSHRAVAAQPFVPTVDAELHERCAEICGIQSAGLAKRLSRLPIELPLNIGISGGLDSTLALLVAVKTCDVHGWPRKRIHGLTMPGFGTTDRTLDAARKLMELLNITSDEVDIRKLCQDTFISLKHKPFGIDPSNLSVDAFTAQLSQVPSENRSDLIFENVQARIRTLLLMSRGFVLGTGDLSEQALGWSTYNGDHMSMYNVNTSIPKTLVKFLVRYFAEHEFDGEIRNCLLSIVDTPISPELLPVGANGEISQLTEGSIGSYELHDFFMFHMIRYGMTPKKILALADRAEFSQPFEHATIRDTLITFLKRFFSNQFKRSCVPDGPKVGSVSLSPRGDWRMPSDAEVTAWIADLD